MSRNGFTWTDTNARRAPSNSQTRWASPAKEALFSILLQGRKFEDFYAASTQHLALCAKSGYARSGQPQPEIAMAKKTMPKKKGGKKC